MDTLYLYPRYYILEGHTPMPAPLGTWGRWFETADRVVVKTIPVDGITISTVFLGLNHQFMSGGPPLLFETMVFWEGGDLDKAQDRYTTWEDAEVGHATMVARVWAALGWPRLRPCLPGSLCEVCLDASAVALQPAPWGGERDVCTACMGGGTMKPEGWLE